MNRVKFEQANLDLYEEALTEKTCGYCGHTGPDVNHFGYEHIGGIGECAFPACDNVVSCIARIEGGAILWEHH